MADEAAGVWTNGTEQLAVSIELILHYRLSDILLGPDVTQVRALSNPRIVLNNFPHPFQGKTI